MRKFISFLVLSIFLHVQAFAAADRVVDAGVLNFKNKASAPATPSAGYRKCWVNSSDGNLYCLNSSGQNAKVQDSFQGSITLRDSGSGQTITLEAVTPSAGSFSLKLPSGDGTVGQAIKTDGAGQLFFDDVNVSGTVPSGGIIPFAGTSAPTGFLMCDGSAVSRTTYAALYSIIGTTYGSGDGSTTFNLPDMRGAFPRGAVPSGLNAITGSGTAASDQATFTAHGINRTGMKVRLSSGTLSGLSTATDYYAIVVDANTLAFASSLANALAGTKISISGSNSAVVQQWVDTDAASRVASTIGAGTGSSLGSWQESQVKKHTHNVTYWQNGGGGGQLMGVAAADANVRTSVSNDGNDLGNETRPVNLYVNYIIKI